jgi:hypothetical protein
MLGMPGLRTFSLSATPQNNGVSCSEHGVSVGQVPLLARINGSWVVRSIGELNAELTACYRLPVDVGSKARAMALIATALNHSDCAMAAIAAVQMQFPDPPPLKKAIETENEIVRRAVELCQSGLLKFAAWDPTKHPRIGTPPNPGWFAPVGEGSEASPVIPATMVWPPWKKPEILEGGGGGGVPRGTLELPFPGGLPKLPRPGGSSPEPPSARPKLPTRGKHSQPFHIPADYRPNLPHMYPAARPLVFLSHQMAA